MENNKKLVMGHVILYAKGWYKRSNEVWRDYCRVITADGRYTPYTRHDVAMLLLDYIYEYADRLNEGHLSDPLYISEEIRKNLGYLYYWKENDTDKLKKRRGMNLENISPEDMYDNAVIMTCHYIMEFAPLKAFDKVLSPSDKVLPLKHAEAIQDSGYKALFGDKNWFDEENESTKWFYEHYNQNHNFEEAIKNKELIYDEDEEDETNAA